MSEHHYTPHKSSEGLNPHVWRSVKVYLIFLVVFAIIEYFTAYQLMAYWFPHDPYVSIRSIVERFNRIVYVDTIAIGFVLFLEIVTNGNLLGRIMSNAYASAILLSVFVLGHIALVLVG